MTREEYIHGSYFFTTVCIKIGCFYVYSTFLPSVEIVTTLHGINLPLICNARLAAFSIPPQQGTSILTREKLIAFLSEQSKQHNSSDFSIPFNRQQLADFLSVDRSSMSNELCKMRDEGLIEFKKNRFVLHSK